MSSPQSHARTMKELLRSQMGIITHEGGFVRLRRTSMPMSAANPFEVDEVIERFRMLVPLRERRNLGFLLDSRDAPMVGDDASMLSIRPVMEQLMTGFPRVAILVQTALGKLQATRRARGDSLFEQHHLTVFSDEAQAIAHVTGQSTSQTGPLSVRGKPV
ncbi:MAG: hypothetical protein IPM54_44880 [Polyangiaceae bacterium]|nr:hypothetical protein [Polyangiaceae bacterium]